MKLGLSSYTFGWAIAAGARAAPFGLDEHGLLDKTQAAGLSLLQVGDNLPLHAFEAKQLRRFAERATSEKIELQIGARGLSRENLERYIQITRAVGGSLLRFVIDADDCHPDPETIVAILRTAEPLLGDLVLGIENHDRFPARTLRALVDAAQSDRVGICLDTVNSFGAGEGLGEVAASLAPRTINLHIKDFVVQRPPHLMGFEISGRPAGQGMLNLTELLEVLAPFDRCKSALLELWTPPEAKLEETVRKEAVWAAQSLDYLRPLFAPHL
jgi:sugar phosphate isomerase/epimerase